MTSFVVYTAILGDYDDLPTVSARDERIRYVCFTDLIISPNSGWEIVPVQSYFSDKKISNGFLKANSHLLFGTDVVSLWVDGNQRDVVATVESLSALIQDSPVAVLPHLIRKTVAEEIEAVVTLGLEHPSTARQWEKDMAMAGFPDDQPLISTCWLLRDHRNRALRNANETWWRLISSGIRRDQLTYNFALWENGITSTYVDVDWTVPNRMFRRIEHKNPSTRELSRIAGGRALRPSDLLSMPRMPNDYPSDVCHAPEKWGDEESDILRRLNDSVHKTTGDGRVEGNYCHFNNEPIREFTPPDPRRSWKRQYLRRAVRGCRRALEVGFNAGHSSAIMLAANPILSLVSVDICLHSYTLPCAKLLHTIHSHRFQFIQGRSEDVLNSLDPTPFDFVHIDGGHDPQAAKFDVLWFTDKASKGCLLLVDDCYVRHIREVIGSQVRAGRLRPVHNGLPSSGENQLFIRC